jgi:hypothetical protein
MLEVPYTNGFSCIPALGVVERKLAHCSQAKIVLEPPEEGQGKATLRYLSFP